MNDLFAPFHIILRLGVALLVFGPYMRGEDGGGIPVCTAQATGGRRLQG